MLSTIACYGSVVLKWTTNLQQVLQQTEMPTANTSLQQSHSEWSLSFKPEIAHSLGLHVYPVHGHRLLKTPCQ